VTIESTGDVVLRPVRHGHRRRSVPGLPAGCGKRRRSTTTRPTTSTPSAGSTTWSAACSTTGPSSPGGRHHRAHTGQHRDAFGGAHLRGPARAHHPPPPDVPGVLGPTGWPPSNRRSGSSVPTASTRWSGRAGSTSSPSGGTDAHAGHRDAARHPRAGQEAVRDRVDANLRTRPANPWRCRGLRPHRHVRRVHRLAGRPPLGTTS